MTLRRYIVRRALLLPPMLLGVTLLTFILSHAVPADPISAELTARRTASHSENDLIDIAPPPVLSGFEGLDERMPRGEKMLGCVPVLRVIATTDMSACQAQSKVHPLVARLQTLLAALPRRSHLAYLIQMPAGRRRHIASGSMREVG